MKLAELIKQDHFASATQEALLNVLVTSSWVTGEMAAAMAPYGITPAQYNVLRILRGSHPATLMCSEIGDRLLDRTPDVTRLLDRLERSGYITRARASYDRRVVEVGITDAGIDLLNRMHGEVMAVQDRLAKYLSDDEQRVLIDLLERLRMDQC